MNMKKFSIMVVDDEEIIRDTMGKDLADEGFSVDLAGSGEEGIRIFEEGLHDLVVVDLMMEGMSGLEFSKKIKILKPETLIVVLTGFGSRDSAIEALRLGVNDYFLKPYNRVELIRTVHDFLQRLNHTNHSEVMAADTHRLMIKAGLTTREVEITDLIKEGLGDRIIAERFALSIHTVKNHIKNIHKKLNVSSRGQLVALLNRPEDVR